MQRINAQGWHVATNDVQPKIRAERQPSEIHGSGLRTLDHVSDEELVETAIRKLPFLASLIKADLAGYVKWVRT